MLQTTFLFCIFFGLFYIQKVDSYCSYTGSIGVRPGEPPITSCNYFGWKFSINSTFISPAPFCERCTCYEGGGMSCCGYGWRGGPIGILGCVRLIDNSTCDILFFDENDTSLPCPTMPRIPARATL